MSEDLVQKLTDWFSQNNTGYNEDLLYLLQNYPLQLRYSILDLIYIQHVETSALLMQPLKLINEDLNKNNKRVVKQDDDLFGK